MKHTGVILTAIVVIILVAGCTSHVPTPSTMQTQAPGPDLSRSLATPPPSTIPQAVNLTLPGNATRDITTYNDAFFLDPVKDYHVGDNITLHGNTILAAGDPLLVEVVSSSFGPLPKSSRQSFTGVSGITTVKEGPAGGLNSWSFSFSTDGFIEDTYIVTVSGITINVRDSTTFMLKPRT
jgi:hypothetical protein